MALYQTSIAYISTNFNLIDKVIYAINLQTDIKSDIKSLEDKFKNL